jgi:hypothetical protein
MICAQHFVEEDWAKRFIEDFPNGQFIHTIRDPIAAVDSWFSRQVEMEMSDHGNRPEMAPRYLDPAVATFHNLLLWDSAHAGMPGRSRAVRFEDMHIEPDVMMRRLARWLGIDFHPCLLESTWNGTPYVVTIRGVPCCGANPSNAKRRSNNLHLADRLLTFALLHDNFVQWNYPIPRMMHRRWVRLCIIALLCVAPMKIEWVTARLVIGRQALVGLRKGRLGFALRAPLFLVKRRLRMMWLIAAEARVRLGGNRPLLQPL